MLEAIVNIYLFFKARKKNLYFHVNMRGYGGYTMKLLKLYFVFKEIKYLQNIISHRIK